LASFESQLSPGLLGVAVGVSTAGEYSIGLDCMPAKHFRGIAFAAKASALLDYKRRQI
jgi:hypothetical protein